MKFAYSRSEIKVDSKNDLDHYQLTFLYIIVCAPPGILMVRTSERTQVISLVGIIHWLAASLYVKKLDAYMDYRSHRVHFFENTCKQRITIWELTPQRRACIKVTDKLCYWKTTLLGGWRILKNHNRYGGHSLLIPINLRSLWTGAWPQYARNHRFNHGYKHEKY